MSSRAPSLHVATPADQRLDAAIARLRAAGFKVTPQRLAIVRTFLDDPTHPTAQDIFARLKPGLPMMSFATVYNTLDALSNVGLSVARALTKGSTRFDPNVAPHDHAVCEGCGAVSDVMEPTHALEAVTSDVRVVGFEVHAVEKVYRGLCAACVRARRSSAPPPRAPRAANKR
jgi:Fe2+ or Zn2+ uptake regulation protein